MGGTPTPLPVPSPAPMAASPGPHPATEPASPALGDGVNSQRPLFGKEAVLQVMCENAAVKALASFTIDAKYDRKELTITVAREDIVAACKAVQVAGYNFFEDVTAVDWYPQEPRFQLSYHILSHGFKQRVRLAVRLDSAGLAIDSITSVWPSANFYEREVFDLFGIHFAGHPRLTRIMMPENWEGHPLRKDYPVEGYR